MPQGMSEVPLFIMQAPAWFLQKPRCIARLTLDVERDCFPSAVFQALPGSSGGARCPQREEVLRVSRCQADERLPLKYGSSLRYSGRKHDCGGMDARSRRLENDARNGRISRGLGKGQSLKGSGATLLGEGDAVDGLAPVSVATEELQHLLMTPEESAVWRTEVAVTGKVVKSGWLDLSGDAVGKGALLHLTLCVAGWVVGHRGISRVRIVAWVQASRALRNCAQRGNLAWGHTTSRTTTVTQRRNAATSAP